MSSSSEAVLPAPCCAELSRFLSRSFENNWNIYKLLAHQKISKEKVRGEPRSPHLAAPSASSRLPCHPARERGAGASEPGPALPSGV